MKNINNSSTFNVQSSKFNLLILSNSPGEITAWVAPVAKEAKKQNPNCHITLLLTPCQYASGEELAVAKAISEIDRIYAPKETFRLLFFSSWFRKKFPKGTVLFLGGDPFYAKLFGLKYRLPVKIYSKPTYKELMYEHVRDFKTTKKEEGCLFMCGSRPTHFFNLLPLITETVQEIKKLQPDFQAKLLVSPFIKKNDFAVYQEKNNLSEFTIIEQEDSRKIISQAKLVVTIPGTNNMEIAYLGKPAMVIFPLNHPEYILFDSVLWYLAKVPLLKQLIFRIIINYVSNKKRYFSIVNEMADKYIYPEITEVIKPQKTAKDILNLYNNFEKLENIKKELSFFKPKINLVEKICEEILLKA
jgi:hypothetical protein